MSSQCKRYRVRFEYERNPAAIVGGVCSATEYVYAPSKLLALWNAREQRHGCMIRDPLVTSETVTFCPKG